MLTPQDVRSVQFEKNLRGYRTEDVDRFLDKIEEQLQQDDAQAEQLRKQIADLTAENQRLHRELQSYEADGEMLKSALIVPTCAATTSSVTPTSCCRRQATAPTRSRARPTTSVWPKSANMTVCGWK